MTKDYAKRKRSRTKTNTRTPRNSTPQKTLSPILIFISGILITLFAVFLWAIVKKPELLKDESKVAQTDTQKQAAAEVETESEPEVEGNTEKTKSDDPEFTYHEALTNKKVEVEVTKPKVADADKTYIMQCGAFKTLSDAEKMKAELAFIGFQASILSKGEWHRVRLGPYNSKRTAESERHRLQDNNYLNCQIW
ncbi:SPOR domain-containing protein [Kangiella sediminilitoris]|uniref:Sporulation domain protein n=1 Tax=Kangiella sediminilitoris TaxID=1144748 RepID=A0A1B3B8H4_9GAMM|nr:SPOR domain-containing protein [Kangiella sediminilitoris]AOE49080.1 Sporulation domain protein [Kangiella sediminilitoris]